MSEESSAVVDMSSTAISSESRKYKVPPIDNNDINNVEVTLLDISCDKKWIAYVSNPNRHHGNTIEPATVVVNLEQQIKTRTYLTVRRFLEWKPLGPDRFKNEHFSLNITELLKHGGRSHCMFLSVSPTGKYVALSFYERNLDPQERLQEAQNPNCLIFEIKENGIDYNCLKIKFQGRAVFLDSKNGDDTLVLVNTGTVEVYKNFPSLIKRPTYWFDIKRSFHLPIESITPADDQDNDYVIERSTWVSVGIGGMDSEMRRLISYSRHMKQNVLVTPFNESGVVRIWSIAEDGTRLASLSLRDDAEFQSILAFSEDGKYVATSDGRSLINIYYAKSDLFAYELKSYYNIGPGTSFKFSHVKFCYGSRYLAMTGLHLRKVTSREYSIKMVFEIWCIETGQSVLRTYKEVDKIDGDIEYVTPQLFMVNRGRSKSITLRKFEAFTNLKHRIVQPFIVPLKLESSATGDKLNPLKVFYTSRDSHDSSSNTATEFVLLDIDASSPKKEIEFNWIEEVDKNSYPGKYDEMNRSLENHNGLKCATVNIGKQRYLIRFGKHTVQLWALAPGLPRPDEWEHDDSIEEEHILIYIRAYKAPDYDIHNSFRETWVVHNFNSIKFIGGVSSGRMIVNITRNHKDDNGKLTEAYHTEEIFLPLKLSESVTINGTQISSDDDIVDDPSTSVTPANLTEVRNTEAGYNYHHFESACQALHYIHWSLLSPGYYTKGYQRYHAVISAHLSYFYTIIIRL